MRIEEINQKIEENSKMVIVGYCDVGIYLAKNICLDSKRIFCDNSSKKQGTRKEGIVYSVEEVTEQFPDAWYVITSNISYHILKQQLIQLGVKDNRILEYTWLDMPDNECKKNQTPMKEIQFEVDIASHCNLNCCCCSQFSPISEEVFVNLEVLERDLKRMSELFAGKAERIYLIGGEPLLNPELLQCMDMTRTYFREGRISVYTNGLLLRKQKDEFWENCRRNRVGIIVTKYPIDFDYQSMVNKVKDEKVQFEFCGTSEDFKYMSNIGLDLSGSQNVEKNFKHCSEANNCVKLANGRLFTCTRPAAIWKFNEYFGQNLEVSEKDSIDIFKVNSRQQVFDFLAHPIPFCKYCDFAGKRKAREWNISEKKMEEWL